MILRIKSQPAVYNQQFTPMVDPLSLPIVEILENYIAKFSKKMEKKYKVPERKLKKYFDKVSKQCVYVSPGGIKHCENCTSLDVSGANLCLKHKRYKTSPGFYSSRLSLTKNKFGNFEEPGSHLVFKAITEPDGKRINKVIGYQLSTGEIRKLTSIDIQTCEKNRYQYMV